MTELEQNIAIAEACGWTHLRESKLIGNGLVGRPKGCDLESTCRVPDFLNDLNAMAEAEKIVDRELYAAQLLAVIHDVGEDYFSKVSWENAHELVTATAAQRAKAFLRTIGKWKD